MIKNTSSTEDDGEFITKLKMQSYLLNLLAVIHRDGGHYTEKHGINKSVKDAMLIVSHFLVKED